NGAPAVSLPVSMPVTHRSTNVRSASAPAACQARTIASFLPMTSRTRAPGPSAEARAARRIPLSPFFGGKGSGAGDAVGPDQREVLIAKYRFSKGGALRLAYQARKLPSARRATQPLPT